MNTKESLEFTKGLASLESRAVSVFLDLFIFVAIYLPVEIYNTVEAKRIYCVLVYSILTYIQIKLLAKNGQTIGKKIMRIRISQFHNPNKKPHFSKTIFLRIIVNNLLYLIPVVGLVYLALNYGSVLFKSRRSLHDYLAGTVVTKVGYKFNSSSFEESITSLKQELHTPAYA
ncbi:MAG: RDD family protein [Methylococcaceae bacterium]